MTDFIRANPLTWPADSHEQMVRVNLAWTKAPAAVNAMNDSIRAQRASQQSQRPSSDTPEAAK